MKYCAVALSVLLAACSLCLAQRREYVELQRDIAGLEDQVRNLKSDLDELKLMVQQTQDTANKTNTSIVALENFVRERLREQEKNVSGPVANIGLKVDQMTSELQVVRESLGALTARFGKLEQQLVDTANAVRTLQAPPLPPGAEETPGGVSAVTLYRNALRDKEGGNLELALKELNEYLESYGETDLASNAQYYIGEIYYLREDFDGAVKAFDLVLEKFKENNKTPDAHYMKGMALVKTGQRNKGRDEFYTLMRRFPKNPLAKKAIDVLKGLGLPTTPPKRRRR
jgi:TolA-binding protein